MSGSKFMWRSGVVGMLLGLGELSIYVNLTEIDAKTWMGHGEGTKSKAELLSF